MFFNEDEFVKRSHYRQYDKLTISRCHVMINKKATTRMTPCRRPCLSVVFTFKGRSSTLPSILRHYKGTKYL